MKQIFKYIISILLLSTLTINAQESQREDAIWARTVPAGTIVLDGNLDEAEWGKAEELKIIYGQNAGLPTSGWRAEFQADAITDPANASVKFLVQGNQLFLGFFIPDSSIGGTKDWARWDAVLMSIKNKGSENRPIDAFEYFYTYWLEGLTESTPVVGASPRFVGTFGNFNSLDRTAEQIAAWDAVTTFKGTSNDSHRDTSMTIEMMVDLSAIGYDVTDADGDVVQLNFSIWDCDYLFEGDPMKINSSRTHWQSPWGNANANNVGRIFARPDVTIDSELPALNPDVVVPNGVNFDSPIIDGILDEVVWNGAYSFEIAFDNIPLRDSYPGVGAYMSGQYQPKIQDNPKPPVLDPAHATIKMFFKDNFLYLAADVKDQLVQGSDVYDQIDGVTFIVGDREAVNSEEVMIFNLLRMSFASNGEASAFDYLINLVDSSQTEWAYSLKEGTTVNENADIDVGYNFEMKLDLKWLKYPDGLGDRLLFMGVMLADGDSFDDPLANYGTRTWWFREHGGGPAVAWMEMDINTLVVGVNDEPNNIAIPNNIELYGNYPNPFNPSTSIKFAIPEMGDVQITIYDITGREVGTAILNNLSAGVNNYNFTANNLSSGFYFYKVSLLSSELNYTPMHGKMLLLK